MSYNLFLDDERHPVDSYKGYLNTLEDCFKEDYLNLNWTIVRTYSDFCNIISTKGLPARISFDHDIADTKEGIDCVKWLLNYCMNNNINLSSDCRFHTANPTGKMNMSSWIKNFKKNYGT